jgi:putative transposase
MARLPRLYLPDCAQHVIQRGNNREACFYSEEDYKAYLSFLKDAAAKYQVAVHAFVLMTNHVHLLATPRDEQGVSRMMQTINGVRVIDSWHSRYSGNRWQIKAT